MPASVLGEFALALASPQLFFDDRAMKNVGMDRFRGVSDCIENLPMDVMRFLRTVVVVVFPPC